MYMWGVQGDLTNVNLGSTEPLCQLVTRTSSTDRLAGVMQFPPRCLADQASATELWEILRFPTSRPLQPSSRY